MENELMRYATREVRPKLGEREIASRSREIYDSVQIAALRVDGAFALANHIMEGAVVLDARRQVLSQGDPLTNMMLSEIEATALRQASAIQRGLYNAFGV